MQIVDDRVNKYLRDLLQTKDELLNEIEEFAKQYKVPIVEPEVAKFLSFLVKLKKPKKILEIGTAIGYSSLVMQKASADSHITTIEIDERNFLKAKSFINKYERKDMIDVIFADANDALEFINDKYDMIFIDAAKGQYIYFFEICEKKLNNDGILVCDNILFRGFVAEEKIKYRRKITIIRRLKEFLKIITDDTRYFTTIIPIDDGISISYKK